ncbi:hypothetical protein [Mycobacterium sp. AT1]|uniref:hypothetical protein n=1 Tax=Mycobacterium sp. AT1 TaxID=1961706 RepID=UPI0009AD70DD|nr:hypothetical protein [Mycobacterium sp. AT1]OPX12871.1 hypothetical protein B1790_02420 [Mycobacterium sp. AT1]
MPTPKRASTVLNGKSAEHAIMTPHDDDPTSGAEDLAALADEAEAEALAAEAAAAAARARARAVKLRRRANTTTTTAASVEAPPPDSLGAVFETGATTREVPTPETTDVDEVAADAPETLEASESPEGFDASDDTRSDRRRFRLRAPRFRVTWVAAALVVLCTLGFLGGSGYMMWHHRQVVAEQQRSAEFAAAARQGVVTLMSLNFNNAKDDVKRIIDNTTGDFKKDFESQSEQFASVAQASKVITEATVSATGVQSMTKDTATVLVAVTTQVSNAASKEQQPRSWRLRVDMARDGGQLKLAKVEFVP